MPCTARWVCGSTACRCRRRRCWRRSSRSRWPRRPTDEPVELRAEMPLVLLDVRREVRPLSPRLQKDMTELVAVRLDPGRIVERARWQGPHAGNGLQREAEVGAAAPAELDFEPSARFVGDVSITRDFRTRHLDLIAAEHDFRPEGRAGPALTPGAMADRHARRLARGLEAHGAAHASAGVLHHLMPSSRSFLSSDKRSNQLCRLLAGVRSRYAGWKVGRVGTALPSSRLRVVHLPRRRMMPSVVSSTDFAAVPPASTSTLGRASSIWRRVKAMQIACSASVGVRLPGGRQNRMLVM